MKFIVRVYENTKDETLPDPWKLPNGDVYKFETRDLFSIQTRLGLDLPEWKWWPNLDGKDGEFHSDPIDASGKILSSKVEIADEGPTFEEKAERYILSRMNSGRLSTKTIISYKLELKNLSKLNTLMQVQRYLNQITPASASRALVIWRMFARKMDPQLYEWLKNFEGPRANLKEPQFLNEEEVLKVRSTLRHQAAGVKLTFELALSMGFRADEIIRLNPCDFEDGYIKIKRKGNKEQRLPISDEVMKILEDMGGVPRHRILPRTYFTLRRWICLVFKEAGIKKKVSPHSLRHTFASYHAGRGVSLVAVQEFMGHNSIQTTARYLHNTPLHLRAVVQKEPKNG